jgi:predicted RND superfamily exporter protein
MRSASTRALAIAIARADRVLLIAIALAIAGWVASTQTKVVSDIRDLVPSGVLSDSGVQQLQDATGVSGELNVIVDAPDITDPDVISWMTDLKARILADGGFSGSDPSCAASRICPYVFLTDLLQSDTSPSQKDVATLLRALPAYFLQAFVAPAADSNKSTTHGASGGAQFGNTANLSFGIRVMPLDEQKQLVDTIRSELNPPGIDHDPPPGVTATVAGIPALAADANAQLSDSRYWLTLVGVIAVALVLFAVYRSVQRALVPLIPIVLATGWAALVIELTQIPLNPMSATLGALVIAIATEFSVILSARYREERSAGLSLGEALRKTYARTGAAVLASGITAIAGFAVLPIAAPIQSLFGGSAIPMLTDFGLATVVDLSVALLGVMIVLPAALVWADGRTWRLPRLVPVRRRGAGVSAAPASGRDGRGG